MCGSTSRTISPSTARTMRKTPCVLGCCGPMLMLMSIVSSSRSVTMARSQEEGALGDLPDAVLLHDECVFLARVGGRRFLASRLDCALGKKLGGGLGQVLDAHAAEVELDIVAEALELGDGG